MTTPNYLLLTILCNLVLATSSHRMPQRQLMTELGRTKFATLANGVSPREAQAIKVTQASTSPEIPGTKNNSLNESAIIASLPSPLVPTDERAPAVDTTRGNPQQAASVKVTQAPMQPKESFITPPTSTTKHIQQTPLQQTSLPSSLTPVKPVNNNEPISVDLRPSLPHTATFITPPPRQSHQHSQLNTNATRHQNTNPSPSPGSQVVHPLLIYSIRFEIRYLDLYNSTPRVSQMNQLVDSSIEQHTQGGRLSKTLIAGLKNTIGLDFYYSHNESYIFWTDVGEERIYRGTVLNGSLTNVNVIIQTGLPTAEGLAVDWVGKNLYWVESALDHIEVATLDGSSRRTLIAGDMENPRAIALDPRYGLMFWSDWDKKNPRIERATMAGEDRQTIVTIREVSGSWPNGLTLDYDYLKIYWIDASSDSIHVVDYEGKNHQIILKHIKSLGHPFAITQFENNLYWTDWKTNSISTADKFNGSDAKELLRLPGTRLFDLKIFHPSRQPRVEPSLNPCYTNNGNCSHICLLSTKQTRKCDCPHLMKLGPDEKTCEVDELVLLIGRPNEIRAVDLDNPLHNIMAPISVPKVLNPRQFEFDSKSKTIFWADSQTSEVKKAHLTGIGIETVIDAIIDSPNGLALDWISGNIYVTSAQKTSGKIYLSNLNGEYISILMDESQGLNSPKSIAVQPMLGLLFCIDEDESYDPIIFMSNMDGRHKRTITTKRTNAKLENPSNLAIDYHTNFVYWMNQGKSSSSIQYYDILNERVVTLLDESNIETTDRINSGVLTSDGDYLIISGRFLSEGIMKISKRNVSDRVILKTQNMDHPTALRVYNASSQFGTNACSTNNGGCSQLCVPSSQTQRACKCTIGYQINPLNETDCYGQDLFLIFSYNLGMKGISLEPNAHPEDYYLAPIHKAFRASSIDFVHRENLIYWVDNEEGSITRINRDTTNYRVIVQGLESEESIGIDWVAGNIYWLDPYYDIIEVARLNGSNRYVIVSGDMDRANGIVVNPIKGYIAWSDVGSLPKIETARLDGSDRRIIVDSNLSHVDDLAIDYAEDYIYWVDSTLAIIEKIKPDGTGRQKIFSSGLNHSQSHLVTIAIYKDYLFVADSVQFQGSIIRIDKNNPSNHMVIQHHLSDGIRDIAIFAEQPMPTNEENPCVKDNGGCQDLCLFLGKKGKKRCICAHGELKSDGLTCKSYDTFLMFSRLSQIDSLHIKDGESPINSPHPPIVVGNRSSVISLAVDNANERIIYSDMSNNQICSMMFNGSDRIILIGNQSLTEGIAFSRDQLYWTSVNDNSISRLNISSLGVLKTTCDGSSCRAATPEKIIHLSTEDKPRGIAVDTCSSFIYWTNWNNANPSIQRASPHNGFQIESIIDTNIKMPNGIAIDQKQRKFYWCDAKLDKIESCDMDGTNRIILISVSPQHPFALAIWNDYVFWTDWLARSVFKANKYTGQNPIQMKKFAQRPMGVAVAAPEIHECPPDPCSLNNGGCSPNSVCRVHHNGAKALGEIECRRSVDVSHDPKAPPPRCRHLRPDGTCEPPTYRDIIMDPPGRYNLSEFMSLSDPKTASSIEVGTDDVIAAIRDVDDLTSSQATTIQPKGFSPTIRHLPSISNSTSDEADVTIPNKPAIRDLTTTASSIAVQSSTTPPPSLANTTSQTKVMPPLISDREQTLPGGISVPSKRVTETTTNQSPGSPKTSTNSTVIQTESSSSTQNASIVQNSPTTLAPCGQIVPAALQSTSDSTHGSDCKQPNQFKCYLSEKLLCISGDRRCDGNHDCPSKEDENDCYLSKRGPYNVKQETNWHRFVTVILIILAAAVAALFLVSGTRGTRRRWFIGSNGAFNHRRMIDDNGTNIEISNPMFDEDDSGNLVHCAFSIDLNEQTTNFSNPLYERQVLLVNDKNVATN